MVVDLRLPLLILSFTASVVAQDSIEKLEERAFKRAVAAVHPSIVQIETIGGLDRVAGTLNASTSTSGLVVSRDGEILTSAFAFAGKPSSILVRLPDGRRFPAKSVATDHVLQLTLLKIDARELVPVNAVPADQIRVGQWSIAVGRTLNLATPSVSVGIISALNRVWGKAVQTDAKVSPVNYGGAIVSIEGKVQGILVPLSPRSPDLVAGVEWYDSGIGFAIPIESAMTSVRRLRGGKDLKKGLAGISFSSQAIYSAKPVLADLRYDSPAENAGLKPGDLITRIDGEPVKSIAQLRHALGGRYAGDRVRFEATRGENSKDYELELVSTLSPWEAGYLGILPQRDAVARNVGVRFVFADSPAAAAGLAVGDRVVSVDGQQVTVDRLRELIHRTRPGQSVEIEYRSAADKKSRRQVIEVGSVPDTIAPQLPLPGSESPKQKNPQLRIGRFTETFESHQHDYWAYVPPDYNPAQSYALVVWIHPFGDTMEARVLRDWKTVCDERGLILLAPKAAHPRGWNANELEFVKDTISRFQQQYSIDPQRVIVHGHATSVPLTLSLAFAERDLVRGVIGVNGGLSISPPETHPQTPLQILLFAAESDPSLARVRATATGLKKAKYPTTFLHPASAAKGYPVPESIETFGRWIDSLDRI